MIPSLVTKIKNYNTVFRRWNTAKAVEQEISNKFETVFSLPHIKYIATLNRLKVYHGIGSSVAVPCCGIMEMLNIFPQHTFLSASYIGVTGLLVLSVVTIPFRNIIGFLYISEDNKHIKISSVDFWGKRVDKVIKTEDWIPLLDMSPKVIDAVYLSPQLSDGSKYKLLIKFGKVLNSQKMGQVLE